MTSKLFNWIESPVGRIYVQGDGRLLTHLYMPQHKHWSGPDPAARQAEEPFAAVREQLAEYFAGERTQFDVPLVLAGTPFQQKVWQELTKIPFGETISYAQLAIRLGKPEATRAVGAANGRNPVSILVPCHRVIAADGKLTGYGGGLHNKSWLLGLERRIAGTEPATLFDCAATPQAAANASTRV